MGQPELEQYEFEVIRIETASIDLNNYKFE